MKRTTSCIAIFLFICLSITPLFAQSSDEYLNVTQLITSKGYECVEYSVTTEDGFVLSMQNIPGQGPPVYLQHGFLDSSARKELTTEGNNKWVLNSEVESLGFILADAGYDVWLGNSRGNEYCLNNIYHNSSSQLFWNWSWDQMAQYDLPAKINFIYSKTSQTIYFKESNEGGGRKISYIGHSEGTLMAFTSFSYDKSTASKVNLFIALAPVVYLNNAGELLKITAEEIPEPIVTDIFGTMLLDEATNDPRLAEIGLCLLAGCENLRNINQTRLPVYFSHFPYGSSVQDFLHYQQMILNTTWQMFNYGEEGNNEVYGQSYPPAYSLAGFNTSVALFYGSNDKMADPTDVQRLISELPYPPVEITEIKGYGHADFVWGSNAHQKLYPSVVSLIQKQTGWSKRK